MINKEKINRMKAETFIVRVEANCLFGLNQTEELIEELTSILK